MVERKVFRWADAMAQRWVVTLEDYSADSLVASKAALMADWKGFHWVGLRGSPKAGHWASRSAAGTDMLTAVLMASYWAGCWVVLTVYQLVERTE